MARTGTPRHDIVVPDLSGRRALVTGGSDGIGLRIASRLAAAGAEVVLPVRNRTKGDAAIAWIRERTPGARVEWRDLELSSLEPVAALGETLRAQGAPIHLLVGNAGVMTPPDRQTAADGFELQLGTNFLGHAALVGHLLPLLSAGRARVVSQVGVAAARGGMHWDDLQWERSYDGMAAYRQSKIAYGLFALELARRSAAEGWGITSTLSHPGVAPTSLLAARPELGRSTDTPQVRLIRWLSKRGIVMGTVDTAYLPAVLGATAASDEPLLYGPMGPGRLGGRPGSQRMYRPLESAEEARRVWAMTEELTGVRLAV